MHRLLTLLLLSTALCATAEADSIADPRVSTLQVVARQRWQQMPIIDLTRGERVDIDFDDLSHGQRRLAYRVEHCEPDWTRSTEIFESDCIDGFQDGNLIEDIAESVGTNTLYTHYHLSLPNDRCRLKMGGNYRVTIYDDGDDRRPTVAVADFMALEPQMRIALEITANTDLGAHSRYQQLTAELDYGGTRVVDPAREIQTVFIQNRRWSSRVTSPAPTYTRPTGLAWTHCRDLVYEAGNEYHKFETLDPTHTTLGLEDVGWDGQHYHAWLWADEPRANYVYDEDANGAYLIRNSDNREVETTTEYIRVHFTLQIPRRMSDIYIDGDWTHGQLSPQYLMGWNPETSRYEATVTLKQGYYNYQYLSRRADGSARPLDTEGSYWQTDNAYTALVYHRAQGERTYRLVAAAETRGNGATR